MTSTAIRVPTGLLLLCSLYLIVLSMDGVSCGAIHHEDKSSGPGMYADTGLDGGFDVGHYPPVTPGTSYVTQWHVAVAENRRQGLKEEIDGCLCCMIVWLGIFFIMGTPLTLFFSIPALCCIYKV